MVRKAIICFQDSSHGLCRLLCFSFCPFVNSQARVVPVDYALSRAEFPLFELLVVLIKRMAHLEIRIF